MKPRHQVSRQAIELIKRFEGYRRSAAALPDGRWTIGYGHTKTAREGVEISEKDAEALLIYDLLEVTKAVNDWTFTPLTQNQFDALVCFALNVGLENFRRSSVLRRVNEGAMLQAACALEMWRKAEFEGERIVVDALVRRRAAEKALFLTPTHGWVPAPSPVVRPRVDYDASAAQPRQRPLSLIVPLDGAEAQAHEEPAEPSPAIDDSDVASPATTAAENVTARLQALVPEPAPEEGTAEAEAGLDLPSPPAPAEPVEAPQPEPEPAVAEAIVPASASGTDAAPAFSLTPPPAEVETTEEEPATAPVVTEVDSRPLPFPEPMESPAAFNLRPQPASAAPVARIVDDAAFTFDQETSAAPARPSQADLEEAVPMKFDLWPLIGLAAAGLVCLGFAVVWALFAAPSTGFFGPWVIAWGAGLLGIGCFVGALYVLLERLGGSED